MNANNKLKDVQHLKTELVKAGTCIDELKDQLREMTQLYLCVKKERDHYKTQIQNARKDLQHAYRSLGGETSILS